MLKVYCRENIVLGIIFYLSSIIAVVSAFRVINHAYPIYALLYLIIHLLSVACIFFALGSYFIGVLEVIIYAGAIMVLFIFVIMMINHNINLRYNNSIFDYIACCSTLLLFILLFISLCSMNKIEHYGITIQVINTKDIGFLLFNSYFIVVEIISMLLLGSLIVVLHLGYNFSKHNISDNSYRKNK